MSWWATTVISLGSALVGGLLAGGGALLVGRRDAHAELAREVRTSLGNYYGALLVTVSQLTRMPDPVDVPDPFGELVKLAPKPVQDWWSASQFVSTERKMRQTLGPEPFAAAERVILMHAPLTILPLPGELRAVLDESLDYILELSQSRAPEVVDRWPTMRKKLVETSRAYAVDADELVRALHHPAAEPLVP